MKRKKIALYDPYLDVLGGGEKHILSIIKPISDYSDIDIFWNEDIYKKIQSRLNISFPNAPTFLPNIFNKNQSFLNKYRALKKYDYFFYVTDGSYFFSTAKNNYVFCMVPNKKLYKLNIINRLKTLKYTFISNSQFTKKWLEKWGIKSSLIYPYIDSKFINFKIDSIKKEKYILSVGRFFKQIHSKRQDVLIKTFLKLKKTNAIFSDYKLILAGGVKKEDMDYFLSLKKMAKDDKSIIFMPNISFQELFNLYKKSQIFWHIAGFDIDENKNPEFTEHFGMSPLEAMAMGCITFAYNAGGLKETIKNNQNGFLFNTTDQLITQTIKIVEDLGRLDKIKKTAKKYIAEKFSYDAFKNNALSVLKK